MKKPFALIVFFTAFLHFTYSASLSEVIELNIDTVYEFVDVYPEFEGGKEGILEYITSHVKYPKQAKDKKESARVFIEFVVDKSGHVRDVKYAKKTKKYFDDEAIRVISSMPKWKAGMKDGKAVNTRMIVPISFKLD